jgi:hypothetical protein
MPWWRTFHAVVRFEATAVTGTIDADDGAIEQRVVGERPGQPGDGLGEAGCSGGEQVGGLTDVAIRGGQADAEPGREPLVGVAVA